MIETALAKERHALQEKFRAEGREEGIRQGELIGRIQTLQQVLRRPVSAEQELREQDLETLQHMLQELETALNASPLMS